MITLPTEFSDLLRQGDSSVLEAESRRYGAGAFMVLPLASGRIAVLGHFRDLHAICDSWEEACQAAQSIPMHVWRRNGEDPDGPREVPAKSLVTTKSAGDLGL